MHIAVVGCGHGEVDKMYEVVDRIEKERAIKVSLLICCGDFQSVRNMTDLRCMACPVKYQHMHDFHRYYSGEKKAPVLTLFIGGNHEASNYLQELPYGGWVAPNIFYLGYVGVVKFRNVRIAGLSGIFKGQDYLKGRFEAPPYDQGTMRSVYHYRNLDIFRMKQLQNIDIIISHDWPRGIHQFGNTHQLLRRKPFFREEIERNELGSRPLFEVLEKVQPNFWFSAHMHVKFAAYVNHPKDSDQGPLEQESSSSKNEESPQKVTKFLALDKVLPRRQFLQILEIDSPEDGDDVESKLEYDVDWLAILKATNHLVSTKAKNTYMPGPGGGSRYDYHPSDEERSEIRELFQGDLVIPETFTKTGPVFSPEDPPGVARPHTNPQTRELCHRLEITDPLQEIVESNVYNPLMLNTDSDSLYEPNYSYTNHESLNPDEISLDVDLDEGEEKAETSHDDGNQGNFSHLPRRRLVLPPPSSEKEPSEKDLPEDKASTSESDADKVKDLELLRSIMGEPSFFIDRQGEEPSAKRKKDIVKY